MNCLACGFIVPKLPWHTWEEWEQKEFCDRACKDDYQAGKRARPVTSKPIGAGNDASAEKAWNEYVYRVGELHLLWLSDDPLSIIYRCGWPSPTAFFKNLRNHKEEALLHRFLRAHDTTEVQLRKLHNDTKKRELVAA